MSDRPLYSFLPLLEADAELNEALREIADSLRALDGVGGGGGAVSLTDLVDVTITAPVTNEALVYNGTIWENQTLAGGGGPIAFDDLTDVSVPAPNQEDRLVYRGGQWVNVGPVSLAFTYNGSDQLTNVAGSGVDIDFTYNLDGTLNTVFNQTNTLTFGYTGGLLTSIGVS